MPAIWPPSAALNSGGVDMATLTDSEVEIKLGWLTNGGWSWFYVDGWGPSFPTIDAAIADVVRICGKTLHPLFVISDDDATLARLHQEVP